MPPTDLTELLRWLQTGAGAALVVGLFSWLVERWPAWQRWDAPEIKTVIFAAVPALIGVLAWAALAFIPPDVLAALAAPVHVFLVILFGFLFGQWFHVNVNGFSKPQPLPTIPIDAEGGRG